MSLLNIAQAATPAATPQAPSMTPLFVIVVVMVLFYVWMWRNQSRKTKAQRDLLGNLAKGDEVMTSGGMMGKIVEVKDNQIVLQIAKETEVTFQKAAVANILPKGSIKQL